MPKTNVFCPIIMWLIHKSYTVLRRFFFPLGLFSKEMNHKLNMFMIGYAQCPYYFVYAGINVRNVSITR